MREKSKKQAVNPMKEQEARATSTETQETPASQLYKTPITIYNQFYEGNETVRQTKTLHRCKVDVKGNYVYILIPIYLNPQLIRPSAFRDALLCNFRDPDTTTLTSRSYASHPFITCSVIEFTWVDGREYACGIDELSFNVEEGMVAMCYGRLREVGRA